MAELHASPVLFTPSLLRMDYGRLGDRFLKHGRVTVRVTLDRERLALLVGNRRTDTTVHLISTPPESLV
jgi:hypothetical protein